MAKAPREKVQDGIRKIRTFYAVGLRSLRARPDRASHKDRAIEREAEERVINPDTLRKARQFADPQNGYSREEVEDLCRTLREHQAVLGPSHIIRLLTVAKKRRGKLQRQAIENHWSTAELEAEIGKRFGSRRAGGRRPRVPTEPTDVLVLLELRCEEWRRLMAELSRPPAGKEQESVSLMGFPKKLRAQIEQASEVLLQLQKAVVAALKEAEPGRVVRSALQPETTRVPSGKRAKPAQGRSSRIS